MLWIEQGGIYAVANIRGGREYGDAWHLAGNLTRKQNVFDDFAACAQALLDRHYTSPRQLAINGASNGGLLMGAELTQHPGLYGAVVSQVGVYDMLREELSPNGLFNTTEYGTVKDTAQFRALKAYSPYHNVHDGTQYPATLLLTGANDPRVVPSNSFKFAARLQASGTTRPILLRTSMTTGHIGTPLNARNEEAADIYSFLFEQLGLLYRPIVVPAP
jgi:prolyl oligopeptidase